MRRAWLAVVLLGIAVPVLAGTTAPKADGLAALLYLSFDGTAEAVAPGAKMTVTGGKVLEYAEGKAGKAADFLKGGCVEYRGLPKLPLKSGTLELWVKAPHDRTEMEDHVYLQFLTDGGSGGIEVKFYHVECSAQATMWAGKRRHRRYGWGWAKDTWQHLVVTWDTTDPDLSGLTLYKNGAETGYPRSYRPIGQPDLLRIGCKSPTEGLGAKALIDEVALYDRCLTKAQVRVLYDNGGKPFAHKLAAVRARVAADQAREARRHDLLFHHRKVGMLHGRFTSLLNWPDKVFTPLQIPVPEKIHETKLASTDLSRYHALFVPGGGGLRLDKANAKALQDYVRNGGGYVGVCGGAVSAARYGLIDAKRYPFGVRGPVWTNLKKHPVTEGYDLGLKLLFPHASGPLFVVEEGGPETPVVIFQVGAKPFPTFVNTIAREFGKGRVVAFSGHPEASPRTRRLLRNAILWAARITGVDANH